MEVVGDPMIFIFSLVLFLSILWNISFYIDKRKELRVARKLIRWVASHRSIVPRTDKERDRLDRVLKTAIWALRNNVDLGTVIDGLNEGTSNGTALSDVWARSHYEMAIERLADAAMRNQMLDWKARSNDLQEGEKWLWAARVENLR
jgi:hypothetical protein